MCRDVANVMENGHRSPPHPSHPSPGSCSCSWPTIRMRLFLCSVKQRPKPGLRSYLFVYIRRESLGYDFCAKCVTEEGWGQ